MQKKEDLEWMKLSESSVKNFPLIDEATMAQEGK